MTSESLWVLENGAYKIISRVQAQGGGMKKNDFFFEGMNFVSLFIFKGFVNVTTFGVVSGDIFSAFSY